jgi:hypothetical protein
MFMILMLLLVLSLAAVPEEDLVEVYPLLHYHLNSSSDEPLAHSLTRLLAYFRRASVTVTVTVSVTVTATTPDFEHSHLTNTDVR